MTLAAFIYCDQLNLHVINSLLVVLRVYDGLAFKSSMFHTDSLVIDQSALLFA